MKIKSYKKLSTLLMSIVASLLILSSCSKDADVTPAQKVTYQVECDYCLVYIEDNYWNPASQTERGKNQHFNVNGKWKYEFENKDLDSVEMRIYTGSLNGSQMIKASISTNDNRRVSVSEMFGFNENILEPDYPTDKIIKIKLK